MKQEMGRRWAGLLLAAAGLVLVATGCTAGPSSEPAPVSSTFLDRLQRGNGVDYSDPAIYTEYYAQRNAIMSACMEEQGFDYISYVPVPAPKVALGLSDEEFAQTYGYGITTLIDFWVPGSHRIDPNDVAIDRLDAETRSAFLNRLSDCERDRVMPEIGTPPGDGPGTVSQAESDFVWDLLGQVQADPRVVEATRERDSCLAEQGYPDPNWVNPIFAASDPYVSAYQLRVYEMELRGEDTSRLRIEDVLTAVQLAELRQLQAEEISIAVARLPCEKPYETVYIEVYWEHVDAVTSDEG